MHKVGVIGLGFVGTAISAGLDAILKDLVDVREYDKFKDTESLNTVVNRSDILFLALPTPMLEDGACDTSIVESVVQEIDEISKKPKAIIVKSTVPPGTTQKFQDRYPRHTFVFSPEFLTEKRFIEDFLEQDRIVLGETTNIGLIREVKNLFFDFVDRQKFPASIVHVTSQEAEMLKYATNCFLATKISFCNEIYQICKATKIDYGAIVGLLGLDKRVGVSHMKVPNNGALGFGGACFPKDLNALIAFAKQNNVDPLVLESVWTKNLMVRENYDWEKLAQVNGKYEKK
ncbi:MAG: hypothetical protein Q7K54_03095 [Candidatus Parcubacteria bacterium]|nr:hypothetical protein [Candidatus Parcubacteria bacterium]